MNFLKRIFESRPLTLPELFSLNAREGLYRGEILQALKDVVLFIALREDPKGSFNLDTSSGIQFWVMPTPDRDGVLLFSYLDQKSCQRHNQTGYPYMVDFRMISKIMENPGMVGLIVGSGEFFTSFTKSELATRGLISIPENNTG